MKFDPAVIALLLALLVDPCKAFQVQVGRGSTCCTPSPSSSSSFLISFKSAHGKTSPTPRDMKRSATRLNVAVESTEVEDAVTTKLTHDIVSKLRFREVQRELERRELDTSGTFTDMRQRLRLLVPNKVEKEQSTESGTSVHVIDEDALNAAFKEKGIVFQNDADPDFDFNSLLKDILLLSEKVHWKAASRKFKKLNKRYGHASAEPRKIPEEVFSEILKAYMQSRLHGARAAEPARRAMEEMVLNGYTVPSDIANSCIKDSLGFDRDGTHEGFGGIDTALAMLTAVELSEEAPTPIFVETYEKIIITLANEGSIDYALQLLRENIVEKSNTPSLKVFADVASACVEANNEPEKLMTGLAYIKATGYDLDNIASTVDGRGILAAGVIAAEKMNNVGLGLRFLTAASKAEGCEPDRGDTLVANLSPASQRACTIIHRRAVLKAVENNGWKLAVKLLKLMLERGLTPSPSVWRNVVVCCAKDERSRKATALLLDWVELYKQGRAENPPLRVFNTVVNACEVCGEEELTVKVLDAMKETRSTEGNLITFNIALKRLAKQGNTRACEGIIVGMLQAGIEPSVVTYTTAIAACVADPKQSDVAVEWIKRMKSRLVQPNVITYNTAFASCLDGSVEGTARASKLASDMLADVKKQVDSGIIDQNDYTNIIPNFYTKTLAKNLMKQLDECESDIIDEDTSMSIRAPLSEMVDYLKTDLAKLAEKQKEFVKNDTSQEDVAGDENTIEETDDEDELEYYTAISTHRAAIV